MMKKLFGRILAGAAAAALLCGFTGTEEGAASTYSRKHWQAAEAVESIDVSAAFFEVEVKAAGDDAQTVAVDYAGVDDKEICAFTVADGVLTIDVLEDNIPRTGHTDLFRIGDIHILCNPDGVYDRGSGEDTTLVITLPRKEYAELKISNDGAGVSCEDVCAQSLTVETVGGGIEIEDCTVSNLSAETMAYNVKIEDCTAQTISAEAQGGSVDIEGTSAESCKADAANGNAKLEDCTAHTFNIEAHNGNVTFENSTAKRYIAKAHNGNIKVLFTGCVTESAQEYDGSYRGTQRIPHQKAEMDLYAGNGKVRLEFER